MDKIIEKCFLEKTSRELKKEEKDKRYDKAFSEYRHYRNSIIFNRLIFPFKALSFFIGLITRRNKINRLKNEIRERDEELIKRDKEIIRLKRVIASKDKYLSSIIINWIDEYLIEDGIFNIGKDMKNNDIIIDFNKFSNLLVGGEPGGGKTKFMELIGYQCLKNGADIVIADFKGLDFKKFKSFCRVVEDHQGFINILNQATNEIKKRKDLFSEVEAENLKEYKSITGHDLKRFYIIIDELGEALEIFDDSLTKKESKEMRETIELKIKSIARLGRALGVNMIVGTQRPDVSILGGQTRDQFSGRVCFKCLKQTSLMVLSSNAAEKIDDTPGRAIVKLRTEYKETQIYLWDKNKLNTLKNVYFDKNVNINTNLKKTVQSIDYRVD